MLLFLVTLQLLLPPAILVRSQIVWGKAKNCLSFLVMKECFKTRFSRFPVQITGTHGVRMESAAVAVAAA